MTIGHNLSDPSHAEFIGGESLLQATEVARSGSLRLRWRFMWRTPVHPCRSSRTS